jgi:hypothetical protein
MTLRIEEGIYYLLANTAGVNGLVGTRITPLPLPLNPTLPALTYQLITPGSEVAHDGMQGTAVCRYQITGFSESYDTLFDLMEHVRICMTGYKGTIGGGGNTIVVQAMLPGGGYESYDPAIRRYMRALDFIIFFNEPIT